MQNHLRDGLIAPEIELSPFDPTEWAEKNQKIPSF